MTARSRRTWILPILAMLMPAMAATSAELGPSSANLPLQARIVPSIVRLQVSEASDIRFAHLPASEGLSQRQVTQMVQDDQGFIWFATQYGLDRYDGYQFKIFKHDPNNPGSLCGGHVWSLFKDRSGTLWIGCNYALDRYDPLREAFVHYPIDPAGVSGLLIAVRHISQDARGMLWLSTVNGLYRFDPRTGDTTRFIHRAGDTRSLSSDSVYSTGEDRSGTFWVATAEGLDQFRPDPGR